MPDFDREGSTYGVNRNVMCTMHRYGWVLWWVEGIINVAAKYLLNLNSQLSSAVGTDVFCLAGLHSLSCQMGFLY